MVRTIYQQLSPAEVHAQLDRVVEQLREPFPQVAALLADAAPYILAFTAFPVAHWQKLWSNNPQERLNREIRRRRACPRKGTWWASSPTGCRRGAGRAARRMGRSPPLPHHPQRRRQRCAARAYYAGRSGLINTDKDDALLHYLTGHHPARNATTEPNEDEYQRIQRELSDWDWTEKGGRPPKRMPSDVARSVLTDVIETGNQGAVVRKYQDILPFSRRWLKRAVEDGRLLEMATP